MILTATEVVAVLGPVDETLVADLLATGATLQELTEAWAWVSNDEALFAAGRPPPRGRVAEIVDLLEAGDDEGEA